MKGRRGFTLIEMLVVIAVIVIMVALLGMFIPSLIEKARYADTESLITNLHRGCESYFTDNAVYPPDDRGGSRSLHYHLGRSKVIPYYIDGRREERRGDPYLEIKHRWLRTPSDPEREPSAIVDAWGNEIGYASPGKYNRRGVDIWSAGGNGVAEMDPSHPAFDDVNTW